MTQYLLIAAVIVLALAFIERFAAAWRWRSAATENFEGIGAAHAELADVVKSTIEPMQHELQQLRDSEGGLFREASRLADLTTSQKQSLDDYSAKFTEIQADRFSEVAKRKKCEEQCGEDRKQVALLELQLMSFRGMKADRDEQLSTARRMAQHIIDVIDKNDTDDE